MSLAHDLKNLNDQFQLSARMPTVFLGHGSPMNALRDNDYSRSWRTLGQALPRPQAILVVSAHWMTQGSTLVDVSALPRTIHDFYGFPEQLYQEQYPAPGAPAVAQEVIALLASHHAEGDETWGLDHGAWTVLKFMYPEADVPVFQLSIDMTKPLSWHLDMGEYLRGLRDRGILILGSGNVVHNLPKLRMGADAFDWATEFDHTFAHILEGRDMAALADTQGFGSLLALAHPTTDHYIPALTLAGTALPSDDLTFMNDSIDAGSISMRSFVFH